MRRLVLLPLAALSLAACQDGATAPDVQPGPDAVEVLARQASENRVIPGQYIVRFDASVRDVPERARSLTAQAGGQLLFVYEHALRGFAARLPEAALEGLRRNPSVASVEPDAVVKAIASGTQLSPPSWGLDRVDERDLPLDGQYYYPTSGQGVTAYILDTGIRTSHQDFGGRASVGYDAIGDGRNGQDCQGHGTHVAGTVGGASYGIAKTVSLVAVRVLDCGGSGSVSGVVAGIDWVTGDHQAGEAAVANMSLGGGESSALDAAVDNSVDDGVFYAVAAGNGNWLFGWPEDACASSPAGAANAYTVGATDSSDREASFSNFGTCVDILAPGVGITSAWIGSDTDTNTISGTSMATPHVTGAAAAWLEGHSGATPTQVADALSAAATVGAITLHSSSSSGGTPNLLLYTGAGGSGGGNAAPTASFASTCADLGCDFDATGSSDDGSIVSYAWNFGDGTTGAGVTASHGYGSGGSYAVTLTVTDDLGATGSTTEEVTVVDPTNSSPTASFTYSPSNPVDGESVTFDATGSFDSDGSIASYAWDFGDGTTGSGAGPSHAYASAGTYTVTLTVTDDDGATRTTSADLTVQEGPNSAPTADFSHLCSGLSCAFYAGPYSNDPDGTIVSYDWDFGDGTGTTGDPASTTYAAAGKYKVTLVVTDNDGATGRAFVFVTVGGGSNSPPTASFTYSCAGLTCAFDASSSSDPDGSITGYIWDFGDGTTGGGVSPGHTYASGGTRTVTLTVIDDGSATDATSQSVTAFPIALTATGYKVKGRHAVDLEWTGAGSAQVDVIRDGSTVITTANDGAYTDQTDNRGGATYTYQVCEAGTATCSNEATVVF